LDFDDGFEILNKRKRIATPAPEDLFKVDDSAVKLGSVKAKVFNTIATKELYVSKQARLDTSLMIAFLTTRVREPDEDDWRKLHHLIVYLKSNRELPLVLGAWNTGVLHWYIDASFAVHPNMQGHTGGVLTLGTGAPVVTLTKQKLNTRSSTISEVVAVDDMIPQILWTCSCKSKVSRLLITSYIKITRVQYFLRKMDGHLVPSGQSISKFDITTLRMVLQREICWLCGVLPAR
jgi:hypothetical protein